MAHLSDACSVADEVFLQNQTRGPSSDRHREDLCRELLGFLYLCLPDHLKPSNDVPPGGKNKNFPQSPEACLAALTRLANARPRVDNTDASAWAGAASQFVQLFMELMAIEEADQESRPPLQAKVYRHYDRASPELQDSKLSSDSLLQYAMELNGNMIPAPAQCLWCSPAAFEGGTGLNTSDITTRDVENFFDRAVKFSVITEDIGFFVIAPNRLPTHIRARLHDLIADVR
jgi:hypothetical protein